MDDAPRRSLLHRYGPAARWYDVLSMEPLLYRGGRLAAIDALRIQQGERVLDVGTGTGLSLPFLADAVGAGGEVVGLDPSPQMLAQARARVGASAWGDRVRLVTGSGSTPPADLGGEFDVVLFAYSLGVMGGWQQAWDEAISRVRPGGRVGVLDTGWPAGSWRLLTPAVAGVFALGGVHPAREVWAYAARTLDNPVSRTFKGGHVHFTVGSVRTPAT
ncbi:MAG: methyltransferase domain-containing protein [Allobranchiibius sp.]